MDVAHILALKLRAVSTIELSFLEAGALRVLFVATANSHRITILLEQHVTLSWSLA